MSLNSKPTNTANKVPDCSNLCPGMPHSGSTPNLSSFEEDHEYVNNRNKRKREDSCVEEIKLLLSKTAAQTEARFTALQASISEILTQNIEIKDNIKFISKRYDDINLKMENLEIERKADRCRIQRLEETIENLERQLCSTKIEIKNIPKKQGESKDDLCRIVQETANLLSSPIEKNAIKEVFRMGKKDDSSLIIVDFNCALVKEKLIKGAREFNLKNKNGKLNTNHLNMEGPAKPVYISEKLTPKAQRIYYLARNFAKENKYAYCWTSFGRVFLRQAEGQKQIPINSEADLKNLSQGQ